MEDQRVLHYFISTVNNFQQCTVPAQIVTPAPVVVEAEVAVVDPNQVDLEDLIAQVEAEEAQSETIVTYTDPVGNTFEAIDFHNEVVSDANQLEDPEDEDDDEDETPAYIPDENQEYTGENASHMKGSDFDIDKDDFIFNINDTEEDDDSSLFF